MAKNPLHEIDAWTEFCDLIVVYAESHHWGQAVDRIAAHGGLPGLAISPLTPVTVAPAEMAVLCMSITPGTAGSTFNETVLQKVSALRATSPTRRIGIDGGVKRHHVEKAEHAGANWLVVGTDLCVNNGERRWASLLTTNA